MSDKLRRIEHVVMTQGGNASVSLQDAKYGPLCWYDKAHAIEQERDALKQFVQEIADALERSLAIGLTEPQHDLLLRKARTLIGEKG